MEAGRTRRERLPRFARLRLMRDVAQSLTVDIVTKIFTGPFAKAFIDAMIPHHRSAIDMARVALEESENEEIRALASDIVDAQTREIRQLRQWRQQWYPEG